jgi:coproporphyrinogen III oxidase
MPSDHSDPFTHLHDFFFATQEDWRQVLSQHDATPWQKDETQNDKIHSRLYTVTQGPVLEKAAVTFSKVQGDSLAASALTEKNPAIIGQPFRALNVSMIVHPNNPHAPIIHANIRFFQTLGTPSHWWFGAAMDLNPCYGYTEDCTHWHTVCAEACAPFGKDLYPTLKKACDDYFYLPHRQEHRGIGGLWLEYYQDDSILSSFALIRAIANHVMPGYSPILARRAAMPFTPEQKAFQHYRRSRYAEFNLMLDRGTRYGLQASRRTETVLVSMPPQVSWVYNFTPAPGSPEERITSDFLQTPRDWLLAKEPNTT